MIGIFTNINKDKDLAVTKKTISLLKNYNEDYKLHSGLKDFFDSESFFDENSGDKFKFIVSIGGDGTILRIAPYCAATDTPILGINMGHLGFLAEVESKDLDFVAQQLKNKNYFLEKRSMLEVSINSKKYLGLNELVIMRENEGKMISLQVRINELIVDNFYCDGFIISTPTGSTAYSLSAGGPILSPSAHSFALTPINTHSLYSRPIVIGNNDKTQVKLIRSHDGAAVFMDGERIARIQNNEQIFACHAQKNVSFIKLEGSNFYSKLFSKLNHKIPDSRDAE